MMPVNKVVIQRLDSVALGTGTMVFTIRETVAEHNIMMEVLRKIRHDYPGAWYCMLEELRKETLAHEEKVKPVLLEAA